jgi:hypothetical protein
MNDKFNYSANRKIHLLYVSITYILTILIIINQINNNYVIHKYLLNKVKLNRYQLYKKEDIAAHSRCEFPQKRKNSCFLAIKKAMVMSINALLY